MKRTENSWKLWFPSDTFWKGVNVEKDFQRQFRCRLKSTTALHWKIVLPYKISIIQCHRFCFLFVVFLKTIFCNNCWWRLLCDRGMVQINEEVGTVVVKISQLKLCLSLGNTAFITCISLFVAKPTHHPVSLSTSNPKNYAHTGQFCHCSGPMQDVECT